MVVNVANPPVFHFVAFHEVLAHPLLRMNFDLFQRLIGKQG